MKKLITILIVLFSFVAVQAQRTGTVISNAPQLAAVTLQGVDTETVYWPQVQGEYDLSLQLIPALSGAGDSLHFTHILYQSNSDADAVWTAITSSVTVSTTTDADGLIAVTDFKGLRLKSICIGVSTDTCTVTPYWTYKKHSQE